MVFLPSLMAFSALSSLTFAWDRNNMDPQLADSFSATTCEGPLPRFPIPGYLLPDGVETTLQKICAQTQYGGNPRGHNAGGFCQQETQYINQDRPILQGNRYVAEVQRGLWEFRLDPYSLATAVGLRKLNLRLSRYCKMRCICTGVPLEQRAPVKFEDPIPNNAPNAIQLLPEIVDLNNLRENTEARYTNDDRQQQLLARLQAEIVPKLQGAADANGVNEVQELGISIHYTNQIGCIGTVAGLRAFSLPPPAQLSDYSTITEVCAVAMSGGHP
jgi:hypothetical protein